MPETNQTSLQPREAALILRVLSAGKTLVAEDVKRFCDHLGHAQHLPQTLSSAVQHANTINLSPGLLALITSFITPITLEYTG
jgi:hypothetical protein